ncbi:hypothetical protein QJS04_geneDACA001977 [Acorus gramineus]|uniref:Leucine-rich repeat-containing N-terminal plant-type domain-containing protein n=1 Tax=Acorus gramineus TaxID=55184 RepID=A0AAV9A8Q9_ACOGR|nr:hypothetical protein QJS04_geneDACA001977 [Acorus gramineus]
MSANSALQILVNHCILFILLIISTSQSCLSISCIKSERDSLIDFRGGLTDPRSVLSSWTGSDCCAWHGVGCDNMTGHVVKLDLSNQHATDVNGYEYSLGGEIRPSLLGLKQLTYLDLSWNYFAQTPVPAFFGSLGRMTYLNLSNAGFGGNIPPQIGNITGLRYLDLDNNNGAAVDDVEWLYKLSSLEYLDLNGVDLKNASNWAQVMSTLPSLSVLRLQQCGLVNIPRALPNSYFMSLTILSLRVNNFNSMLPDWLFHINSLIHLDLSLSQFVGAIPDDFISKSSLVVLDLSYNHLQGKLPKTIGNLRNLQQLDLSNNEIGGEIPVTIGNLIMLQNLDLSWNNISGEIPSSIGNLKSLRRLVLTSNHIEGRIPKNMGNLCNLQTLDLSLNSISGSVESFSGCLGAHLETLTIEGAKLDGRLSDQLLSQFSKLKTLDLNGNLLNGSIPASIGKLLSLTELNLGRNKLSGIIPSSIGQLSELERLDLSSNYFEGVVSEVHFAKLTKLKFLYLSSNLFTFRVSSQWVPPFQAVDIRIGSCHLGPDFPAWLRSQTKFSFLDISNAKISDTVPNWFWNLSPPATFLNLSRNQMRGQLPHNALEFGSLQTVDLRSNQFVGPLPRLPSAVEDLLLSNNSFSGPIVLNITETKAGLRALFLSNNVIEGSIPSNICTRLLFNLDLSNNYLSGELPNCWATSSRIETVNFANNNLSGTIPVSVGSIYSLKSLHLNNNGFSGEFPPSLNNSASLVVLDLSGNKFSGPIPTWIGESLSSLKVLRLRSNRFDGSIPPQLSQLSSLQVLDLAHNNLLGTIPPSFGNFSSMAVIHNTSEPLYITLYYDEVLLYATSLDLSNNGLSGEIPGQLTKLFGLQFLDLSWNRLTGKIPRSIGELSVLESLYLSHNQLSGKIPQGITTLTSLVHLNLSYNELSGKIPLGNDPVEILKDPSVYIGNPNLCGYPLPPCPGNISPQTLMLETGKMSLT